jgi:hypothetical protein
MFVTFLALGAFAQHVHPPMQKARDKVMMRANTSNAFIAERVSIYTNDFSECSDFVIDNALENGFTQFVELQFECGNVEPEGFAAIAPIASSTADNGFMMVDSDGFNGEEDIDGIENCWFQTANPIDCSAYPFVSLSFETFYRMWDGGASDGNEYCLVEISRDGVTWPDVETFEVADGFVDFGDGDGEVRARWELWPEMETQDPVANPTIKTFDITAVAGGQDQVWIRFRWKGNWGYAWMVDDLELFETPAHDLRLGSYTTYTDFEGTGMYEVGAWPQSQVTEVQIASAVESTGTDEQTNTVLSATVNGEPVGGSEPVDFTYQMTDTLRIPGYQVPSELGTYEVGYAVASDFEDENPQNNTTTQSFEVTEFSYGRDDGVFTGVFPDSDYNGQYIAAVAFQFFADATIYSVDVALYDGDEIAPLIGHILNFPALASQSSTEGLKLHPDWLNNQPNEEDVWWYPLCLEDPWQVSAGETWVAAVESPGGDGVRIGESKFAPDQTCFVKGDFGNDGFDWYFTNAVPMIRFNLDPDNEYYCISNVEYEGVSTSTFELFKNAPNPAVDVTRIRYKLNTASEVVLEVRDLTGKLIETRDLGTQVAGEQIIELNVSEYATGMYQYALNVNGERATRKFIVK